MGHRSIGAWLGAAGALCWAAGCGGKTALDAGEPADGPDGGSPRVVAPTGSDRGGDDSPGETPGDDTPPNDRRMPPPDDREGSCNANFCPGAAGYPSCCIPPSGPCGLRYGGECVRSEDVLPPPPPEPSCDPNFCPSAGPGDPCCTDSETCGLDLGFGCNIGSCGERTEACVERIDCPCVCSRCQCEWQECLETEGCLEMFECSLRHGCAGPTCFIGGPCTEIFEAWGGISGRTAAALVGLDVCSSGGDCGDRCRRAL